MNKQLQDPLTNLKLEILYMSQDILLQLGTQSGNVDFVS